MTDTPVDLEELGEQTLETLKQAIGAGQTHRALELAERLHQEYMCIHDGYLRWTAALMSFIGRRLGDAATVQAIEETLQYVVQHLEPPARMSEGMSAEERLQKMAFIWRGHGLPFVVREGQDAYELVVERCGSGGRLIRDGAYEGEGALHTVKKALPDAAGRKELPVYCVHCAVGVTDKSRDRVKIADKPGLSPCIVRIGK